MAQTRRFAARTSCARANSHDLPEGLTGLIPSRFGPLAKSRLISPWGKLRMGMDYFIPPKSLNGDESLAQFVERRLGRELYDRMIEPLMSGIYAGDGEQLSLGATFPQLRQTELEHGSLVKGMLAAKKKTAASRQARRPAFGGHGVSETQCSRRLRLKRNGPRSSRQKPDWRKSSRHCKRSYRVLRFDWIQE